MRIGIDAKWYFEGPPSGQRVVKSLVDHMLMADDTNEYFIFLNKKHEKKSFRFAANKNVTLCYIWAGNNLLSNVLVVPFYANRYNLDVCLYQNFISPFDRSKKIAYIHDVLFLSNPEFYTVYERIYFMPLKFLTRKSDKIITVSEEERKRLMKFGFSDSLEKIIVAHHGVDNSFMPLQKVESAAITEVRYKFTLPDEFLLYVGRLNLRKNVDHLLRSIPLLRDKKIKLLIVGADNWKASNHIRIIRELGIDNRVHFTGAVYKELPVLYSLAKIFCFPSYAESFGLPPLEAMASGVPVVVSNTTSLPEICGNAASYISPDKPQEIANAIDALLSDDRLYSEKKELGLEQAKKFTWERAAEVVINCMKTIKDKS